jgi:hypothetical protein
VAFVVGGALVGAVWPGHVAAAAAPGPPPKESIAEAEADMHAAVVAAEDRRLTEIRTVTSLARWQGQNWKVPYRLGTSAGYTLVLTQRSAAYTIEDLLQLAPQTFLRMSDGSYVLSEHVIVTPQATLRLSAPGGLRLRLASNASGFSTIVSLGGRVELLGEAGAAVEVTSWDPATGAPDTVTADGRAYLRAIGGQFTAEHVRLSQLGFWSGRTGGLALTGTDRPNTGAIATLDPGDDAARQASLLGEVTWQPAGPLQAGQSNPALDYAVPALDYVSARLNDVAVDGNAFGLFVSGANGVQVNGSTFSGNAFGGVVLHRYVTNGVISRTVSRGNAGDGFAVDRATTGIVITESIASGNAGNGFSLDGRPLADGPSAVGAPVRAYGNNSVSNSRAEDNGRYGVELLGGANLSVTGNIATGHDMGIVVEGPATGVSITGNTVRDSTRHGIAVVDEVTGFTVTGNVVERSATGVYLRDSTGAVRGNTIQAAAAHGVSLVGRVGGSEVSFNVLAGRGASALDTRRSNGEVATDTNNLEGWHDTTPWHVVLRKMLRPMNALWTGIIVLIVLSAIRARRSTKGVEHPYAHQLAHHGAVPMPQPLMPRRAADDGVVITLMPPGPTSPARPAPSRSGRTAIDYVEVD